MSMSACDAKGGVRPDIHVTPMADIMIVLLITFMVATSKIARDDRFALPPALHAEKQPESALLVKVTRGGVLDAARRAGAAAVVMRTQPDAQSTRNP